MNSGLPAELLLGLERDKVHGRPGRCRGERISISIEPYILRRDRTHGVSLCSNNPLQMMGPTTSSICGELSRIFFSVCLIAAPVYRM
jgi:hypothetical protein